MMKGIKNLTLRTVEFADEFSIDGTFEFRGFKYWYWYSWNNNEEIIADTVQATKEEYEKNSKAYLYEEELQEIFLEKFERLLEEKGYYDMEGYEEAE